MWELPSKIAEERTEEGAGFPCGKETQQCFGFQWGYEQTSLTHYQRAELRSAFWSSNVIFALVFPSLGKFWYNIETKCCLLETPDLKYYKREDILKIRLLKGVIKDIAPQVSPNSWSSNLDAVIVFKIELALRSASWRGCFDLTLMCFSASTSAL